MRIRVSKYVKNSVWMKYHGNSHVGRCYCCHNTLYKNSQSYIEKWQCSHVIAVCRGGSNRQDNLRVCCSKCNYSMKDMNLYKFIELISRR